MPAIAGRQALTFVEQWLRKGSVPLDYPAPVARDWPDLLKIVEERVRPERQRLGDNGDARRRKSKWWLWGRYTPALYTSIDGLDRVLVISQVTQHHAFSFVPSEVVYSHRLYAFSEENYSFFAILQSSIHEVWARFFGSSLEETISCYAASDCFETFPFADGWDTDRLLEAAGRSYYEFRAALMVENDEGMTKTYNRFNDIYETDPHIVELRELHAAMDRVVLDAYGWPTSPPTTSSSSTTRSTRLPGAARRSLTGTAGPTPPVTKSSRASSPSTPNALQTRPAAARPTCAQDEERRQRQARRRRAALAPDSVRPRSNADLNE